MAKKITPSLKLSDYPEEVIKEQRVKIYGETSYENQMAVVSHFLHNAPQKISKTKKKEIILAIKEFLSRKNFRNPSGVDFSDEEIWKVAEPHN